MVEKFILLLVLVLHLVFFAFAIINGYKYMIQDEAKILEIAKKRLVKSVLGLILSGVLFWLMFMWLS